MQLNTQFRIKTTAERHDDDISKLHSCTTVYTEQQLYPSETISAATTWSVHVMRTLSWI